MQSAARTHPVIVIGFEPSPTLWLRLAVIYLIVGVGLGIAMGISENFTLRPVHAHLNLLGWTTLALAGLIYRIFPEAGASRAARIHFWLHNLSLPGMMGALTALLLGNPGVVPILAASEIVAAAGVIVFAWNVLNNVKESPAAESLRTAKR